MSDINLLKQFKAAIGTSSIEEIILARKNLVRSLADLMQTQMSTQAALDECDLALDRLIPARERAVT